MLGFEHALRNDDDHTDERVEAPLADDQVPQHVRSWCPMAWLVIWLNDLAWISLRLTASVPRSRADGDPSEHAGQVLDRHTP